MGVISFDPPKGVRKGESCSLLIKIPETRKTKELTIKVPHGVKLPEGNVFRLAPKVRLAHVPLSFSQNAPTKIRLTIKLTTESGERFKLTKVFPIRR